MWDLPRAHFHGAMDNKADYLARSSFFICIHVCSKHPVLQIPLENQRASANSSFSIGRYLEALPGYVLVNSKIMDTSKYRMTLLNPLDGPMYTIIFFRRS